MKRKGALCVIGLIVALAGASAAPRGVRAADHPNPVITWNGNMVAALAIAGTPPAPALRLGAIVQAAVFDAVNGVEPHYTAIHVAPAAPEGASREAAAVGAAYTALALLFPAQKTALDGDLAASLAALDGGHGIPAGLAWGKSVAEQIVSWRSSDGFSATPPPYVFGSNPGDWQPTPGGSGPPKFRTLAATTPFAMTSPSQFRPAGPPALTSAQYTADFNEVKAFGSATSTVRTAYQTETARFWQLDTPVAMWDRVADALAESHHLNLLRTARLLALVNAAEADGIIAVFDAKNAFNFWRPVTAIVNAGLDGNPNTSPDPSWLPLMTTPYFQEYPSAHSGVSSAAASILASVFGQDTTFTVTSAGLPGVERSFSSFSDGVAQVADARVYAGFHYRFSCEDGIQLGTMVAHQVESKMMQRLGGDEGD